MQDRPTRESARAKAIGVISSIRDRHGAAARGLAEAVRAAWPESGPAPEFVVIPSAAAAASAILGALRSPLAYLLLEDASKLPAALAEPLRCADGEGPLVVHLPEWSNAAAVPPAAVSAVAASLAAMRLSTHRLERSERRQRAASDTVRRLDRELLEAARLQREFLPRRLPRHPRFECAVLWRPACHVSGDTYEIARLDRDRIGIFIADAVGHGLPAAIVAMGLAKRLRLRDRADPLRLLEPSEVLRQLNDELVACRGEMVWFATASYALFDLRRGEVTVASAGHPPPLLLRPSAGLEPLETRGALLGIFPRERFEQRTESLAEDDRLLLHSDGFEQAFPADLAAGELPSAGYLRAFASLDRCESAIEMRHRIAEEAELATVADESLRDDLTLVCARFGTAAAATVAAPPDPLAA